MNKILIIRFSSIGDVILTTPVVRCLKKQANVQVHYLTKKSYAGMLQQNPYVDHVHTMDQEIDSTLIQNLKAQQFNFVIDLHGNWRSLRIKKSLGIASKTFAKLNFYKWLLLYLRIDLMPQQHVVDRYLETVAHMGVSNDQQGLDYFIPSPTKVEAVLDSPFIAWSLGGSFVQKKLEVQQVADACKKISLPIFLLGGPEEAADAEAIMEACGQQNIQNFCGKFSLDQTALLIKNCRLLLSNDTGLMHIGAAFKKSIISFWGCTKPSLGFAPYGAANNSIQILSKVSDKPCSKHGKSCKHSTKGCVKFIEPKEIEEALISLLQEPN